MFRMNFWTRPFLGTSSGHGQNGPAGGPIDYSGSGATSATGSGAPYVPLPLSASPALMVLASGSESGGRGGRATDDGKERRVVPSTCSAAPPGVISPHHHAAFGTFPFFRPGPAVTTPAAAGSVETATAAAAAAAAALQHQLPPIFSHLHQSLLRSHFDSAIAAAHLHQARLGAAALLGHRLAAASSGSRHHHHQDPANGPSAAAAYPSAFLPAAKRDSSTTARGYFHYADDERFVRMLTFLFRQAFIVF